MGIVEAMAAVRRVGVIRAENGRLLIEVDRRHLGTLEAHIEVLRRCKAQAVAILQAETTEPTQAAIDAASDYLNRVGAGVQRKPEGYRLTGDCETAETKAALKVLGLDHLPTEAKEMNTGDDR